jgi:hypothetical protein
MAKTIHDVTHVFWSLINFICDMPRDALKRTPVFDMFEQILNQNGAFKLHISVVDTYYPGCTLPYGIYAQNDFLVFENINRLFLGLWEMYIDAENDIHNHRGRLGTAIQIINKYCEAYDENEMSVLADQLQKNNIA